MHQLATRVGLTGFVGNSSEGVFVELEGAASAVGEFQKALLAEAPPLAVIDHEEWREMAEVGSGEFEIRKSVDLPHQRTPVAPDARLCEDCRRELLDPVNRRYLYPFLNCTNCGPRYTIVRGVPYDRPLTSMAGFALCPSCEAEYHDPLDRRFHAQPTACPECGPRLSHGFEQILGALYSGQIVALQGLGGFHLVCDAGNAEAVAALRERKARGDQPFAVMVASVAQAQRLAHVDEQSAQLMRSTAAPIVLLSKRNPEAILAPGNGHLGLMLPYTPLHELLFSHPAADGRALVVTSGNRGGEPICRTREEAAERLGAIADVIVTHDRPIEAVADDSLVRLYRGRPHPIRRSRGYAPLPVGLPVECAPTLATGAELKAVLGLAARREAYLSPHVGDMENLETLHGFERTLEHMKRIFRLEPERVVCDAHPGYLSTQWAEESGLPVIRVQHHRAHAASVLAEYGLGPETRFAAAIFDGTGYGEDGAIWGGEVFGGTLEKLARLRHLPYVSLPGGDAAARRPRVCFAAYAEAAGLDWGEPFDEAERRVLAQQMRRGVNCFRTSSMGRLFDGVAAFLGVRMEAKYEAQAAIEMEALATLVPAAAPLECDAWEMNSLWRALYGAAGSPAELASRFHTTIAHWTLAAAQEAGEEIVVLSGGVWQNVLLLERTEGLLEQAGFRVLAPRLVPANDAGLALGQLYLAALARV